MFSLYVSQKNKLGSEKYATPVCLNSTWDVHSSITKQTSAMPLTELNTFTGLHHSITAAQRLRCDLDVQMLLMLRCVCAKTNTQQAEKSQPRSVIPLLSEKQTCCISAENRLETDKCFQKWCLLKSDWGYSNRLLLNLVQLWHPAVIN